MPKNLIIMPGSCTVEYKELAGYWYTDCTVLFSLAQTQFANPEFKDKVTDMI
jgi:hypothetical protein